MKNSFSIIEIIISIFILSILTTFFYMKSNDSLSTASKIEIKSQIAMIRNSIKKYETKNTLLGIDEKIVLDSASIEKENSKLFENILEKALLSTNSSQKELGKWIKVSSSKYKVYINNEQSLDFEFKNSSFVCQEKIELCKEYE